MDAVVGVDAGASKTRALLLGRDATVLARAQAPGANLLTSALAHEHVAAALRELLAGGEVPSAVALCAAGAEDRAARERARAALERLVPGARAIVTHDALAALYAGSRDGVGVVLLSGTGSIAYGRDARGREARAGGWGYLIGDEGSAAWLGIEALRSAARAADGRGPATLLRQRILEELKVEDLREALSRVYGAAHPSPAVIGAARVLARVAEEGRDDEARRIVAEAADELTRAAVVVAERLELDEVFLGGGAFGEVVALEHAVRARIAALLPAARVETLRDEPARGAARIAALAAWNEPT